MGSLKTIIWKSTLHMPENRPPMSQNIPLRMINYTKKHLASLGTLLAVSGAFYLYAVIRTGWAPTDWATHVVKFESLALSPPILSTYLIPTFFVTSLPVLVIGTTMLCVYSIKVLRSNLTIDSEHVAILLTAGGFSYQVLGAWPLQDAVSFAWEWQKQIVSYGLGFAWFLYALSLGGFIGWSSFAVLTQSRIP